MSSLTVKVRLVPRKLGITSSYFNISCTIVLIFGCRFRQYLCIKILPGKVISFLQWKFSLFPGTNSTLIDFSCLLWVHIFFIDPLHNVLYGQILNINHLRATIIINGSQFFWQNSMSTENYLFVQLSFFLPFPLLYSLSETLAPSFCLCMLGPLIEAFFLRHFEAKFLLSSVHYQSCKLVTYVLANWAEGAEMKHSLTLRY